MVTLLIGSSSDKSYLSYIVNMVSPSEILEDLVFFTTVETHSTSVGVKRLET